MKILLTESPEDNGYIESLINSYKDLGHEVCCGISNFYFSNYIPDMLHIHWPERLHCWYTIGSICDEEILDLIKKRLEWYKNNSVTIVYTVHNLSTHEGKTLLGDAVYRLIIAYADVLVHHCEESINYFYEEYEDLLRNEQLNIVCRHGDYLMHYKKVDKRDARQRYGIPQDRIVTINFGIQREYKNERFIVDVYNAINYRLKYLLIAGKFDCSNSKRLKKLYYYTRNQKRKYFGHDKRKYIYRAFPVGELPYILACADIAFLGQTKALNSGFISLAATYSIPIVMPELGCFRESAGGWRFKTYRPGDLKDATNALNAMYKEVGDKNVRSNTEWLKMNSWRRHAEKITSAVRHLRS
ncbi:hypothetical protein ACFL3A_13795 [Pseudomonadota bacterium]